MKATTLTRASVAPGTVTNSRAELLATVSPGITRLVAGAAACGSQAPPDAPPSQTEAATWPELVCTCSASACGALHERRDVLGHELVGRDRDGVVQPGLQAGVGEDGHVDAGREVTGVHQVKP